MTWSGAAGENPVDPAIADLDEDGLAGLAVASHETDYGPHRAHGGVVAQPRRRTSRK